MMTRLRRFDFVHDMDPNCWFHSVWFLVQWTELSFKYNARHLFTEYSSFNMFTLSRNSFVVSLLRELLKWRPCLSPFYGGCIWRIVKPAFVPFIVHCFLANHKYTFSILLSFYLPDTVVFWSYIQVCKYVRSLPWRWLYCRSASGNRVQNGL